MRGRRKRAPPSVAAPYGTLYGQAIWSDCWLLGELLSVSGGKVMMHNLRLFIPFTEIRKEWNNSVIILHLYKYLSHQVIFICLKYSLQKIVHVMCYTTLH